MKSRVSTFLLFVISLYSSVTLAALPVPDPPPIDARSYFMIDHHSGKVLAAYNEDERVEPASITKLMTAYAVYKSIQSGDITIFDKVKISAKAWKMEGSRMFVEVGKEVSVDELLNGMIVQSGNDATVALAEHVAGTEEAFVGYMNHYAKLLGLNNTHYMNSTGLPHPDHFTSAKDIVLLSQALIREFPEYYKRYSIKEYTYNHITQPNRNRLLWRDKNIDGIKTGHTESAGWCLVASGERDDMRLISVVLGAKSDKARADLNQALLNYGYRFFETHKLRSKGEVLHQARVWKGASEMLPLGLDDDFYVTIPRGAYNELDFSIDVDMNREAPVEKGSEFGTAQVKLDGEVIASRPLRALDDVPAGGVWEVARDTVLQWFE